MSTQSETTDTAPRSLPASSVTSLAPPSQMTSLHIRHAPDECTNRERKCRNHYQLVDLRSGALTNHIAQLQVRQVDGRCERRRLRSAGRRRRRPGQQSAAAATQQRHAHGHQTEHRHTGRHGHHGGTQRCGSTTRRQVQVRVQGPSVAMVHTKVRLFYPLAHVQWPMEKSSRVH